MPPDDPESEITDPENRMAAEPKKLDKKDRSRNDVDARTSRPEHMKRPKEPRERSPKRRKRKEDDDAFDPMDPSTYSDAPKGS